MMLLQKWKLYQLRNRQYNMGWSHWFNRRARLQAAIYAWRARIIAEREAAEKKAAEELAAVEKARADAAALALSNATTKTNSLLSDLEIDRTNVAETKVSIDNLFNNINSLFTDIQSSTSSSTVNAKLDLIETDSNSLDTGIITITNHKDTATNHFNDLIVAVADYTELNTQKSTANTYINQVNTEFNAISSYQTKIKTIIATSELKISELLSTEKILSDATTNVQNDITKLNANLSLASDYETTIQGHQTTATTDYNVIANATDSTGLSTKINNIVNLSGLITENLNDLLDIKTTSESLLNDLKKIALGHSSLNDEVLTATNIVNTIGTHYKDSAPIKSEVDSYITLGSNIISNLSASEDAEKAISNITELKYNNQTKLTTTDKGVNVTGEITVNGAKFEGGANLIKTALLKIF